MSDSVLITLITSVTTIICATISAYVQIRVAIKRDKKNVLDGINWLKIILPSIYVGGATLIIIFAILWSLPTSTSVCRDGYQCNLHSLGANGDKACTDNIELVPPLPRVSGININMTRRALPNYGYSIWEVKAYESTTSTNNLITSTGAQAKATSTEDSRFIPQKAIDGIMDTRWGSALCCIPFNTCIASDRGGLQCNVKGAEDPQSLEITLLKPATVGRIAIEWQDAYALDYCVVIHQKPALTDSTYGIALIALIVAAWSIFFVGVLYWRKQTGAEIRGDKEENPNDKNGARDSSTNGKVAVSSFILGIVISLVSNVATTVLPKVLDPYLWLSWPLLAALIVISVFLLLKQ